MKIIQFIASNGKGGAENVMASLANALSKKNDVEIKVLLFSKSPSVEYIDASIPVQFLHFHSRFNPFLYFELCLFFWHEKPDIIHTHSAKATEIIHRIRHLISAMHVATKHNARKGEIFNKIFYVTAVSKDVQKSILQHTATVIYNGIMLKKINTIPHPQTPFHIYAIGRLDKIKAYDLLIEACSKLSFDFRLHIVGEGKEKEFLERIAHQLNLTNKVVFEGFQSDIPSQMNKSDLVVISSHSEGFSVVMVESLFYAPLLISTKVSGAIEILDEIFLVTHDTLTKKIEEIYFNYVSYYEQFIRLKDRLQPKLRLEAIAQEYLDFYKRILKK